MSLGFHRPTSVRQALELRAELGLGALVLAGGTEINLKHHPAEPEQLISLADLELAGVGSTADGGLVIGATTTFQELLDAAQTPAPLERAARNLVNRNVRNMATVGGQLAAGKSCGDLIPCLVALDARVLLATLAGSASVDVLTYVATKPEGLIVGVEISQPTPRRGVGLANFTRSANDLSVLTAAASMARGTSGVEQPILALGGIAPTVVRLGGVEQALAGSPLPDRSTIHALVAAAVTPIDDLRGSAAFKRKLAAELAADVLAEAWLAAEV